MDLRPWNIDIKRLREIILMQDKINESIELALKLHSMVHCSEVSGINEITFEDELWNGLNEKVFNTASNKEGFTIAYSIWHTTRIEDITVNILINNGEQVFNQLNWKERINSSIIDTGNAMTAEERKKFSKNINMQELRNYRIAVGKRTREVIKTLNAADMKRKVNKNGLEQIINEGAVLNVEASNWLIDFWGRKNVAGIILMPATRHHTVHLNEALQIKSKAKL